MTRKRTLLLALLAGSTGALLVACALNPQPIPPEFDEDGRGSAAASSGSIGEGASSGLPTAPQDPADAGDQSNDSGPDVDSGEPDAGADDGGTDGGTKEDAGADGGDEG